MPKKRRDEPSDAAQMPRFSMPEGSYYSLSIKPPFYFTGVTTLLFPLRANLDALQQFCNNYLNIIPPEAGRFRAPVPYVYLMLLDYGKMAIDVANVGWLAQREIVFCIPLEWYRVEKGRWIFHDWATISPFIYVDDDMSMTVGRTVYGWPKTLARLTPTLSAFMQDPLAPVKEATASTMVFPELYAGKQLEQRVFLEIAREAPISNFRLPVNPNSPIAPWVIASNVATAMAGFGRDAAGLLAGLGVMPMHAGTSGDNYLAMMQKMMQVSFPFRPDLTSNTLNLKQFRSADRPDCYCYQALTNGPMRITAFNRAGLLGEDRALLGDVSGGFSILLHQWPSLPIVETLGLEVSRRWRGAGADVALLKPVLPLWYDVNMEYLPGYNVARRGRDAIWCNSEGREYAARKPGQQIAPEERRFNTTLAAANKAPAGPFRFANTTIRVLPLLAYRAKLEQFIQSYLNKTLEGSGNRFELWGPPPGEGDFAYVYLTATTLGDVTSSTDNIGDWADAEVAFLIPVKRERCVKGEWKLRGVGLVPAFTYVDSVTAAAANSEVLGIPTTQAIFGKPESAWMTEKGPGSESQQMLLRVDAEVLPVVGEGQKSSVHTILDIAEGTFADPEGLGWRVTADRWSAILRQELERKKKTKRRQGSALKHGRALAVELLGNRVPVTLYTLKQFRDVADPDLACYQSMVRIRRTLEEVLDLREIERPLMVRVHEFPTQPLVELLGLVGKVIPGDAGEIVYAMQPIRPFWTRVSMNEALGERLLYRDPPTTWCSRDDELDSYLAGRPPIAVGVGVGRLQDQGDPRRMAKTGQDWNARRREKAEDEQLTLDEVEKALRAIEPQTILESILSREWGNWDESARWRVARQDLQERLTKALAGIAQVNLIVREQSFFTDVLAELGRRPGEVPVVAETQPVLEQLEKIGYLRSETEVHGTHLSRIAREYADAQSGHAAPAPEPPAEALAPLASFLASIDKVSDLKVKGEPYSPDHRLDFAYRDNDARLGELNARVFQPIRKLLERALQGGSQDGNDKRKVLEMAWMARESFIESVDLARERYELQREALLNLLARGGQKPDYVIRRDSAGPDEERLFPLAESWDGEWYVGPELSQ